MKGGIETEVTEWNPLLQNGYGFERENYMTYR